MGYVGAFTFVLHSHLPYARQAGMWPHGEEWVHEALAETYVPLLAALYDLVEEGTPFHLTIGITPMISGSSRSPASCVKRMVRSSGVSILVIFE